MKDERAIAARFYRTSSALLTRWRPVLKDAVGHLSDTLDWNEQEREKQLEDFAFFCNDALLRDGEAAEVFTLVATHTRKPADDELMQEWTITTNKRLREEIVARHGQKEADRRLQIVREFIAKRPGVAALLRKSGVGSHPKLVMALVDRVDDLHMDPSRPKATASGPGQPSNTTVGVGRAS